MAHSVGIKIYPTHFIKFLEFDLKRKFGCYNPKGVYHLFKSLRSNQQQRFLSVCIAYGKQKSRKPAYVICMIMGEAYNIYRLKTPALLFDGNLSSLTAVYKYGTAIISHHK